MELFAPPPSESKAFTQHDLLFSFAQAVACARRCDADLSVH
jgi:hypothetical protein